MTSINDLLKSLGVEDGTSEKTAGVQSKQTGCEVEKAAQELGLISRNSESTTEKVASQNNGGRTMNLQDLYNVHFESEKTASAEFYSDDVEKTAAAELESAGEQAGLSFSQSLNERLFKFAFAKQAGAGEASATIARSQSAHVGDAELETNYEGNNGAAMDTDPEYYDLLDKAVAKKSIEAALAKNETTGVEGIHSVDTGLSKIKSQAQA
jgi:hypothetical protein